MPDPVTTDIGPLIERGHRFLRDCSMPSDAWLARNDKHCMFHDTIDQIESGQMPSVPLTPWRFVNIINTIGPQHHRHNLPEIAQARSWHLEQGRHGIGSLCAGLIGPAQPGSPTIVRAVGGIAPAPDHDAFKRLARDLRRKAEDEPFLPTYAFTSIPWAMNVRNPVDPDVVGSFFRITIIDATSWYACARMFVPHDMDNAWGTTMCEEFPYEAHGAAYSLFNFLSDTTPAPLIDRQVRSHDDDPDPTHLN